SRQGRRNFDLHGRRDDDFDPGDRIGGRLPVGATARGARTVQENDMATIYKEFFINAEPAFVWEALKDVGAVDTRLAKGFVTDCVLSGDERTVTFANGFVARERIVSLSDELRRIAYALVGGTTSHHNASFQVLDAPRGHSRVLWFTDLLPDDMR